jgi:phosphoribosylformimino-5-aminoimidazole carboxamide ribotide isomerase
VDFIPAVDILQGQCVRLFKGDRTRVTIYHDDPIKMAETWQAQGASRLHIVNLDGAFGANNSNSAIVEQIVRNVPISVQLGGGIRTLEDAQGWIDLGVSRVILGTIALTDPDTLDIILQKCLPDRVIVGLDARQGLVAVRGWEQLTDMQLIPCAKSLESRGVERVIYTDIQRDGAMTGPDYEGTAKLCQSTSMRIIASGGFATLDHFKSLCELEIDNLEGAVVGKALYEKSVVYSDLLKLAQ